MNRKNGTPGRERKTGLSGLAARGFRGADHAAPEAGAVRCPRFSLDLLKFYASHFITSGYLPALPVSGDRAVAQL